MQAIKLASARTGVDFSYLVNKASQESNFDNNAKATGSSATGLFQFTRQTWLQMIKSHGAQYGLGQYANQITTDDNGVAHVSDPGMRHAILDLRKNATVSAEMSGELDKENMSALKADVGGKIGPTELYLAHFLGAGGASDFISKLRSDPHANAATVLPDAAEANPSVFYDKSGAPRSVSQIYKQFAQKFDHAPQIPDGATMLASADMSAPADITNVTGTPAIANNHAVRTINTQKPTASSLYTAMVIAQMNMQNTPDAARLWGHYSDDSHKKNSTSSAAQNIG